MGHLVIYFIFNFYRYKTSLSPLSFGINLALAPLVCISVRAVTFRRIRPIGVLKLLSKGSLPEDIIKCKRRPLSHMTEPCLCTETGSHCGGNFALSLASNKL